MTIDRELTTIKAMRSLVFALAAAIGLVAATSEAAGSVRQVSLTSKIRAGSQVSLTVTVAPSARCKISVIYNTTTESRLLRGDDLVPKSGGRITWTFVLPKNAIPGRTPITVSCGGSGVLRTELRVGPLPQVPRILSARLVEGTKYGRAVRVSYCFRSMPRDPWLRPARLHLTVDNLRDGFPPLSVGWEVKKRCGTITHPVGGIKPPYVLRYSVESVRGSISDDVQIPIH